MILERTKDDVRSVNMAVRNNDVIDLLMRCKIATVRDLCLGLDLDLSHKTWESFRKKIMRMEKAGVLRSYRRSTTSEKYVYLNETFSKTFLNTNSPDLDNTNLIHEVVVSKVVLNLKNLSYINTFFLPHDIQNYSSYIPVAKELVISCYVPDAIGIGDDQIFAFEIELFQKDRSRIFRKFQKILKSQEVDKFVYFFSSPAVFKNYIMRFDEFVMLRGLSKDEEFKLRSKLNFIVNRNSEFDFSDENNIFEYNGQKKYILKLGKKYAL